MNAFADILEAIAHAPIEKRAMTNHGVLNEAYAYAKPSSFSRGMRIDIGGVVHSADLGHGLDRRERRQRSHRRLSRAAAAHLRQHHRPARSEGATWHDIVRTSCYLRDIDRDYDVFNAGRTAFFKEQGLDPLPASTGIQAHLCRPELLIEIEAIAMFRTDRTAAARSSSHAQGMDAGCGCALILACAAQLAAQYSGQAVFGAGCKPECEFGQGHGQGNLRVWRASAGPPRDRAVAPYAGEPPT
jgi:2-iminobutanoate/2-iminopropanoate deaminase